MILYTILDKNNTWCKAMKSVAEKNATKLNLQYRNFLESRVNSQPHNQYYILRY
jgi:hypothetical protein